MKLEDELKVKRIENEKRRAVLNIIFTGNWLNDRFGRFFRHFDLSEQQFNVLRILKGQHGQSMNLCDVQERMLHRVSNATRLVEKLRQKGFVKRVTCKENRRKVEISITPAGLEWVNAVNRAMDDEDFEFYDNLTQKEAKQLSALIEKLRG